MIILIQNLNPNYLVVIMPLECWPGGLLSKSSKIIKDNHQNHRDDHKNHPHKHHHHYEPNAGAHPKGLRRGQHLHPRPQTRLLKVPAFQP